MAIIPYAVDVPYDRRPVMNWLLVGSVVFAYVLESMAISVRLRENYQNPR